MIERAPNTLQLKVSAEFLNRLPQEEMVTLLNGINDAYYYWNKIRHLPLPAGIQPYEVWNWVKINRRNTPNRLQFGSYHFHWNTPNPIQEYLHFLDLHMGNTRTSKQLIPDADTDQYLISSIMEEAIASSQIEGAVTTRKQAKEMLRQNKKPTNRSEQMIVNNYKTIKRILALKNEALTYDRLLEVHELVTQGTLHHHAEEGALRNDNDINVVDSATGEVIHHPPDVAEIDELLKALFCFFNDEEATPFIHPLVKASIIHFMVGYIHPFVDGNGRTARALYYWYLLKKDYWLIEYLSVSRLILRAKAQYAKAYQYTEVDEHDLTYFILFSLKITKLAYDELNTYIQRKNEEKEMLAIVADTNGISYRQSVILEWYSHEPTLMITVKEVQRRLGISNQSARTDLQDLVTKGYLQTRPLNKVTNGYTKGANYATLPFGTVNG